MWENEDFTVIFCQHLLDSLQTFFRKNLPRSWVPAQNKKAQNSIAFYGAMHFSLSLWWLNGKESACQCKRQGFDLQIRKIPWRRKWQPAPVFMPGECNGQRSLAGYSPQDHKELDMMEQLGICITTLKHQMSSFGLHNSTTPGNCSIPFLLLQMCDIDIFFP